MFCSFSKEKSMKSKGERKRYPRDLFRWDLVCKSLRGKDKNLQESDAQTLFPYLQNAT